MSSVTTIKTTPPEPANVDTATTTSTRDRTGIFYSPLYLHTVPGTLKCVCCIFVLLGFICIQLSQFSPLGKAVFFSTIAMICFWATAFLIILYLFQVVYVFTKIPWPKVEFFYCAGATLFLMIASSLVAAQGLGLFTAASFFGFVAMCAYGYDAWLKYRDFNTIVTQVIHRTTTVTVA